MTITIPSENNRITVITYGRFRGSKRIRKAAITGMKANLSFFISFFITDIMEITKKKTMTMMKAERTIGETPEETQVGCTPKRLV